MTDCNLTVPDIATENLLNNLTSGVLIVRVNASDNTQSTVQYLNKTLLGFLGYATPDAIPYKGSQLALGDLVSFSKSTSDKGQVALVNPILDGYLHVASRQEFRIKLKCSELPENEAVYLIDPYSEEQAISQAHSDFVSVVSHEFRTPLTSIKGFADTMLRYGGQLPPEQQTRFINIIKDQADRLTRMVENLLTASKLGSGKMEMAYRAIPLESMVEKVTQNILAKASQDKTYEGREVQLDIPSELPDIWADKDKLEQVLTNLIDNAVKYSFPDTEVQVQAGIAVENNEHYVFIRVQNEGVGIPPEHLAKVFTKFSRIDNPLTRQVEGTGLGLYITKTMCTSMGGTIKVESVPDEITTFTAQFLIATPERQAEHHQALTNADHLDLDINLDLDESAEEDGSRA